MKATASLKPSTTLMVMVEKALRRDNLTFDEA